MFFPGFIRRLIRFGAGIETNTINERTAGSGVTIDGCLIKDGGVSKVASTSKFSSTELTGTGAAQSVAHGLAGVPTQMWAVPVGWADTASPAISEVTATGSQLTVTVTSGVKFRLFATL